MDVGVPIIEVVTLRDRGMMVITELLDAGFMSCQ